MCTLAFAYKMHPDYPFIFIGNRDEFFNRPSEPAHLRSNVIAGIDLEKGGTWTGITTSGRMAFITNYRDFSLHKSDVASRGVLTKAFLEGVQEPLEYVQSLRASKAAYNPYNIVIGTLDELIYYSNVNDQLMPLTPGIYGLSNAFLDTPWPKVNKIKKALEQLVDVKRIDVQVLFGILEDREEASEDELPNTGIDHALEKTLSAPFIALEAYGTRFETVILIHRDLKAVLYEKSRDAKGIWHYNEIPFVINNNPNEALI